jgi:hypothetical protein
MPNKFADDPEPPHTPFWGKKNKFDQRAEDVLDFAYDRNIDYDRLSNQPQLNLNIARKLAIPAAAQSLKDKNAAKRAKAEAEEAKARAEEEEARRIAYEASEEGQRAKQKEIEEAEEREKKKEQKKQRDAAEKEERRIKREAEEAEAREAKKQKEADEKAARKAKVEAEQKAAADKKAAKEAEAKAKAEAEKAKPKAAAAATPQPQQQPVKKKNKGATAAAAGGDDLDDFLEQEIKRAAKEAEEKAKKDKQIEEQRKKSETEGFAAKARQGAELALETDENSEITCGVIGLVKYEGKNREAPEFSTDRMKLKKVLGRGYELITEIGIERLLALIYCAYKTLVEMQHTVVGTKPNGDKIYMNQATVVGNWWNVFSELQLENLKGNGWSQAQIATLPRDMIALFDRFIIPAVWGLARNGKLVDGTNTPNVRVYPYVF